ncbi:MAG TPA: Ig-like domain-containing protein, partial [Candidatus Goldiibacteriota bacterium]|nr:Ig-like domain-containing protein [Candidatus Goldiibacteriota bacterium]
MDTKAYSKGKWYHRVFDINAVNGRTEEISLSQDTGNIGNNGAPTNSAGTFNGFFDNIRITDSSGVTIHDIFSNANTLPIGGVSGNSTANSGGVSAGSTNNWVYIIGSFTGAAYPTNNVVANGVDGARITATVRTPSGTAVQYAIVDFNSEREEDTITPVRVNLNNYAVTDNQGRAFANIKSTKAGSANVTLSMGHLSRIVTVNFIAGPPAKVSISPDILNTQTGVTGTLAVKLVDQYGNWATTSARGITVTSNSGTMTFSRDNGVTWSSSVVLDGSKQTNILVVDTTANTATVTGIATAMTSGTSTVYVNNAPADHLVISPLSSTTQAGVPYPITVQAKDINGNNAFSSALVNITRPILNTTMEFSENLSVWASSLATNLKSGAAYL